MTAARLPLEKIAAQPPLEKESGGADEPPPVLKSWKNIYWVVIANLLLWIALFTYFTWTFQ